MTELLRTPASPRCSAAAALLALLSLACTGIAHATTYPLPKNDDPVVGGDQTVVTVYEDTLYDLARKFSLGSEEMITRPGCVPGSLAVAGVPG